MGHITLTGRRSMDEIQKQLTEVLKHWKNAFETARGTPAVWQPYLSATSLDVLNEAVETVHKELSRLRAPSGFTPIFHLAKTYASTSLASLVSVSQQLETGQYNQLPNFTAGIVQLLTAIHTMAVFSLKQQPE